MPNPNGRHFTLFGPRVKKNFHDDGGICDPARSSTRILAF